MENLENNGIKRRFKKWLIGGAIVLALPLFAFAARTNDLWVFPSGVTSIQPNFSGGLDILLNGSSHYINFNTITGSSGYGFRDSSGTMQFKNSGGNWTSFGSGAGGSGGGSWSTTTSQVSGQLINYPNNNTDIVAIGASSTSTAPFWYDPNTFRFLTTGSTTINGNATTTGTFFASIVSSTQLFGANLTACTGTNALTWSGGLFTCTAQPQGTVTSVTATAPIFSSGGATPSITWAGLATTSQPAISNILVSNGGAGIFGVATSSASCSGGASCSAFTVVGSVSPTISVFNFPWTPTLNYGANSNATSTPLWARVGLFASSTSSFDQLNIGSSTVSTMATSTIFGQLLVSGAVKGATGTFSNLTSGNCVQASTNGFLTTTGSACGSGGTGLSSYDAWTHPQFGSSATTSGMLLMASSTIGDGTQAGGLTITGGATTTGVAVINQPNLTQSTTAFTFNNATGATSAGGQAAQIFFNNSNNNMALLLRKSGSGAGHYLGIEDNNSTPTFLFARTGNLAVGATTTPYAKLGVLAATGDNVINRTLFAIASSTASATTTLFSVDNIGTTTLGRFGACNTTNALTTDANGVITCGAISGGTGLTAYDAFTHPATYLGYSATSTSIAIGTTTPNYKSQLTVGSSTAPQLALVDNNAASDAWTIRSINKNLFFSTSSPSTFSTSSIAALTINSNGYLGVGSTSPTAALSVNGNTWLHSPSTHIGNTTCNGGVYAGGLQGMEVCGTDNTDLGGVQFWIENKNNGANAWVGVDMGGDRSDSSVLHFFGSFLNGSNYTSTGFGTLIAKKNLGFVQNSDGMIDIISSTSTDAQNRSGVQIVVGGTTDGAADVGGNITFGSYLGGYSSFGSTTPRGSLLTLASSTAPQLQLSDGKSVPFNFRAIGNTLYLASSSPSTFATSTNPILTIDSTGTTSLLVATTSNAAATLAVTGRVFFAGLTPSGAAQTIDICANANNELISDTGVCIVSSKRFKHDIVTLTPSLSKVLAMNPVSFVYNLTGNPTFDTRGPQIGFIAEEANLIDPRLVELDGAGQPKAFLYQQYTALLTKGMQEFYKQFQSLVARVSGLESKLNTQQKQIDHLQAEIDALK